MTAITVRHPQTGEPLPAFVSAKKAAELLGRDPEWVATACESGAIPALAGRKKHARWEIPTLALLKLAGFETGGDSATR